MPWFDELVVRHRWLPYVAPMAAFLGMTSLEGVLAPMDQPAGPLLYPWLYGAKLAVVVGVAWICRSTWRDFQRPTIPGTLLLGSLLGILIAWMWVEIDPYTPKMAWLGGRSAFDPRALPEGSREGFLFLRSLGLVAVVPVIEELFWRSFLLRWLIKPEFWQVPIGKVTAVAALVSSGMFALAHPEWLAAFLTGMIWAGLLWRTKSLSACLVSHSVANAGLGLIVLATGRWEFL